MPNTDIYRKSWKKCGVILQNTLKYLLLRIKKYVPYPYENELLSALEPEPAASSSARPAHIRHPRINYKP